MNKFLRWQLSLYNESTPSLAPVTRELVMDKLGCGVRASDLMLLHFWTILDICVRRTFYGGQPHRRWGRSQRWSDGARSSLQQDILGRVNLKSVGLKRKICFQPGKSLAEYCTRHSHSSVMCNPSLTLKVHNWLQPVPLITVCHFIKMDCSCLSRNPHTHKIIGSKETLPFSACWTMVTVKR